MTDIGHGNMMSANTSQPQDELGATVLNGLASLAQVLHNVSDRLLCWPSTWLLQILLLSLLALPLHTKWTSTSRYQDSLSASRFKQSAIPVVPYWFPGISHLIPFLWDTTGFILDTIKRYGWERPVLVMAATTRLALVVNPQHVVSIFKSSRFLSTKFVLERVQKNLVGIPPSIIPFYAADDSGMAAEPRKGSKVAQDERILFHQAHTHHKWLASPHLEPLVERFLEKLHCGFESYGIGKEWVEFHDLFAFLQSTIIRANIETLLGTKILELNPNLVEDFCIAKTSVPGFLKGWPRWLIPKGFNARDRVIEALEKWHAYGYANGDYTTTEDSDPDWDPIWGSKCEKVRQQFMLKMDPLTAYSRACEDWGFLIGLNYNTPPTVFWYFFEALKDPGLHARLMSEVARCRGRDGSINTLELAKQPLLESAYAEVLRLRVSIIVTRTVQYEDVNIGGYRIPRGDVVLMPTDSMHFNREAWAQAGRSTETPLEEFDADRFLEPSDGEPRFSLDGLAGLWIPYGGGDRMCPGRHLVKMEMLIIYAYLFSKYEIRTERSHMNSVKPNTKYTSYGSFPPDRAVKFSIRRKT